MCFENVVWFDAWRPGVDCERQHSGDFGTHQFWICRKAGVVHLWLGHPEQRSECFVRLRKGRDSMCFTLWFFLFELTFSAVRMPVSHHWAFSVGDKSDLNPVHLPEFPSWLGARGHGVWF